MERYSKIKDLVYELCLLWTIHDLGGWVDDDVLFPKYVEKLESARGLTLKELVDKIIEHGYPKDDLEYFLIKNHSLSIDLIRVTIH